MAYKVLIIGGGGFIGARLVQQALEKGYQTTVSIRPSTDRTFLPEQGVDYVNLSLTSVEKMSTQLSELVQRHGRWDLIVHNLGATQALHPSSFYRTNYDLLVNVVKALRIADAFPRQFIYMSSLGAMGPGDSDSMSAIRPDDPERPNNHYGKSKQMAEAYLREQKDLNYIILRPTGVYGPGEKDYFQMIKSISHGVEFEVEKGSQIISFIYVDDLVRLIYSFLERTITRRCYLVSDGANYSSREYSEIVRRLLGKKHLLRISISRSFLRTVCQLGEFYSRITRSTVTLNRDKASIMGELNWKVDSSSLQSELDFHPEYDLERGLTETLRWYKEHRWI